VYVIAHGILSQLELACDFLISETARNESDKLLLPISQAQPLAGVEIRHLILPGCKTEEKSTERG
jgi:hypothetical protein